jgi:hypothetical protein
MNPQISSEKEFDMVSIVETASEEELLAQQGFTEEEIVSLLYLRQRYQTGGSDRVEIIRYLEFLKLLVTSGRWSCSPLFPAWNRRQGRPSWSPLFFYCHEPLAATYSCKIIVIFLRRKGYMMSGNITWR